MSKKGKRIVIIAVSVLLIIGLVLAAVFFVVPLIKKNTAEAPQTAAADSKIYFSTPEKEHLETNDETGLEYPDNELLLSAVKGARFSDIEALVGSYQGEIVGCIEAFDEYQIRFDDTRSLSELNSLAEELEENELIEHALPDYAMRLKEDSACAEPNDPWGGDQDWDPSSPDGNNWGVEKINAPQAWDHRDEMSRIAIGLIDSGFEDHEDLTFAWTRDYHASDHGCHVAGTMAADFDNGKGVTGVMPTNKSNGDRLVDLMGVECNRDTDTPFFTMEYKCALAELLVRNVKVINISQGYNWYKSVENGFKNGYDSSCWTDHDITDKAREKCRNESKGLEYFLSRCLERDYDFVIVCCAGNDKGIDATYSHPLNAINGMVKDHIIVVGGISNSAGSLFDVSRYRGLYWREKTGTNLGKRVDVMAPAVDIYSCYADNNYGTLTGTSMAAPHVSGTAAMVWASNPALSGKEVKQIITQTADRAFTVERRNSQELYYILNAQKAVNRALGLSDQAETAVDRDQTYGIGIGKVADAQTKEMISHATVTAYKPNGEQAGMMSTDEYGQFELSLDEGEYDLTATKSGYGEATIKGVTIKKNEINYLEWFYLKPESAPTERPTERPTEPAQTDPYGDFLIGDWSTSDGVGLSFYEDGVFVMDWGFFPEEGDWYAEQLSENAYLIEMDGSGILSLMTMVYGGVDTDYHFEVLKRNDDSFYLVQVYGDYTAESSPCKLGFTRD